MRVLIEKRKGFGCIAFSVMTLPEKNKADLAGSAQLSAAFIDVAFAAFANTAKR